MHYRLRSTVAAVLLVAPLAATLATSPALAATPPARTAAAPSITTMSLNSDAGLSPGATLRVQVQASPGASAASVALGEGGVTVPLTQQSPGKYAGTYVVRRHDRIDPMQMMTARVTVGERTYSRQFNFPPGFQALAVGAARDADGPDMRRDRDERLAERRGDRDEREERRAERDERRAERAERRAARDDHSPDITELMPANGERVGTRGRVHIGARLSDDATGIDPAGVRLRVNGRDVTADSRVSAREVEYRADLEPGRYTVEVTAHDQAGNSTRKTWAFDVVPSDRDRVGGGALPLNVTNLRDNAVVDAGGNLAIQGHTAPFANVRVQVESVANVAGVLGVTQPVADQTVQADREGNFGVRVSPRGLPIPGTRYDVHLTATSGNQTAEERLTLLQRQG